jgi:predicted AlkP superfamily pyrophosphatase or phosphodiesterase
MKLLVIGIDSMTPKYVLNWQYTMPNIARLIKQGSILFLTADKPSSYANWTSIYTGLHASKHGIYGGDRYDLDINLSMLENRYLLFWEQMNIKKLSVGLVDTLLMDFDTADRIDRGWFICENNNIAHKNPATKLALWTGLPQTPTPPGIECTGMTWEEATQNPVRLLLEIPDNYYSAGLEKLVASMQTQLMNFMAVYQEHPVNVGFVYNVYLDYISHFTHHEEHLTTLVRSYAFIDFMVGRYIQLLQPENVIIVSDHGGEYFDLPGKPPEAIQLNSNRMLKTIGRAKNGGIITGEHKMPGLLVTSFPTGLQDGQQIPIELAHGYIMGAVNEENDRQDD